jgi:integrase/recombinase XerD
MLIKKLQQYLKLKNYSQKTIKNYCLCAKSIYIYFKKPLNKITKKEFEQFLINLSNKNYSYQTINQHYAVFKLILNKLYSLPFKGKIPYAKKTKKLPVVLTLKEIKTILKMTKNKKHKTLLSLAYGSGLRVSEVVNLKVKDVLLNELTLHIKKGKGKKDRITVFPEKIKLQLKNLIAGKDKNSYVFESQRGGKLTTRTAQKIFKNALKKTKIKKDATFHSLRHSFATHLLENGVSIRYVQKLLGHSSIKTTQAYTKVTNPKLKNIKSPLDK